MPSSSRSSPNSAQLPAMASRSNNNIAILFGPHVEGLPQRRPSEPDQNRRRRDFPPRERDLTRTEIASNCGEFFNGVHMQITKSIPRAASGPVQKVTRHGDRPWQGLITLLSA